jgi:hypothetical protein
MAFSGIYTHKLLRQVKFGLAARSPFGIAGCFFAIGQFEFG